MAQIIKLYEELKGDYDASKEHPEKFLQTLAFANEENKQILDEALVKLKPSQWIVLSIEPEVLEKVIGRARDLGFLDAYIQNPSYLTKDVDEIVKRMANLEHLGIPYKNENGRYLPFLFSKRGYDYIISKTDVSKYEEEETVSVDDMMLKELADRVMETFALEDVKEEVYQKILNLEKGGFSYKELLIEVFKNYSDNLDYLSVSIDEIIANMEEDQRRVA